MPQPDYRLRRTGYSGSAGYPLYYQRQDDGSWRFVDNGLLTGPVYASKRALLLDLQRFVSACGHQFLHTLTRG